MANFFVEILFLLFRGDDAEKRVGTTFAGKLAKNWFYRLRLPDIKSLFADQFCISKRNKIPLEKYGGLRLIPDTSNSNFNFRLTKIFRCRLDFCEFPSNRQQFPGIPSHYKTMLLFLDYRGFRLIAIIGGKFSA